MDIFSFSIPQLELFMLVLFRILALIMILPFFASENVFPTYKILISLALAMTLFPIVKGQAHLLPDTTGGIIWAVIRELFVGFVVGFVGRLVFAGIETGAQFAGVQMGFGSANIMDPISNTSVIITARFHIMFAVVLFLTLNGHHIFISAIVDTFTQVPIGKALLTTNMVQTIINYTGNVFVIAVKISAPITLIMILTNMAMGLLARFIPQVNVFVVSFPITVAVGLVLMAVTIPFIAYAVKGLFDTMTHDIYTIISML